MDEGQDLTGFRNEDFESEEVMGQQTRRSERVSTAPRNLTYDSDYQQQGYQRKEVSFDMNDYEGITEYLDRNWKDLELSHHMFDENDMNVINQEYSSDEEAMMAAKFMVELHENVQREGKPSFLEICFGQQYVLPQGIKKFGPDAIKAAERELDQLHKQNCFTPVDKDSMTVEESDKEQPGIMLVNEKEREKDPDKRIKGRFVYDGSGTRD